MQITFIDNVAAINPAGNYPAGNYPAESELPTGPMSEPVKQGEINRVPFETLGDLINSKVEKNEIDLGRSFVVVLNGTIKADGKLDLKKSKFVRSEGNEQMLEVAKQGLQALGDSGFLGILKEKGIDKIEITLAQNDNEMYAILLSDVKTPEKAATIASMMKLLLTAANFADNKWHKKIGRRE